jgi:hypothetical protein
LKRAACILFLIFPLEIAFSDGGTVQLRKHVGSFLLTLFSAPVPLRAGIADLGVMVQKASNQQSILDARVSLELSKPEQDKIAIQATRAQSDNKLLYGARVTLPSPGVWQFVLSVTANGETVQTSGNLSVLPEQTPLESYWPYFAIPPLAIFLFVINQWLKSERGVRRFVGRR